MAGFWHLSHHQMRDVNGGVYAGAKAYFFEADTLAPIVVYADYGLGTAHPNPVAANSSGIFPPVFFDETDGFYRQRVTTSGGVIIPGTDVGTLPIIGPSVGGGGSEVPVDPNSLFATGMVTWIDQIGTKAGWVRDNGRTLGAATSGASERANSDTEALFLFLYGNFSNTICPVSGGRGASAAADWAANKTITLPNKRGFVLGGLEDMGNTASGAWTGAPIVSDTVTTAGGKIGNTLHTLTTAQIPSHNHTLHETAHSHTFPYQNSTSGGGAPINTVAGGTSGSVTTSSDLTNISIDAAGGGTSHNNVQYTVLGTFYRKL